MRSVGGRNIENVYICQLEADAFKPGVSSFVHSFELLLPIVRINEVLEFHDVEFPHPEDKFFGRNLVPEILADLSQTERQFGMQRVENILEVYKHALSGLAAQVCKRAGIFSTSDSHRKHEVELAGLAELVAVRTLDLEFFDLGVHLIHGELGRVVDAVVFQ